MEKCIKEIIKMVKKLEDDKITIQSFERQNKTSTYQESGDRIDSGYDFCKTRDEISRIDTLIRTYKHAANVANTTIIIPEFSQTIDVCLIEMAQINNEIKSLERMSREKAKDRSTTYNGAVEYTELNYSLESCKQMLDIYQTKLQSLQLAIDRVNLTHMIEI